MAGKKKAPPAKSVINVSLSPIAAEFVAGLPWGTRSKFVSDLVEKVAEKKAARAAR